MERCPSYEIGSCKLAPRDASGESSTRCVCCIFTVGTCQQSAGHRLFRHHSSRPRRKRSSRHSLRVRREIPGEGEAREKGRLHYQQGRSRPWLGSGESFLRSRRFLLPSRSRPYAPRQSGRPPSRFTPQIPMTGFRSLRSWEIECLIAACVLCDKGVLRGRALKVEIQTRPPPEVGR